MTKYEPSASFLIKLALGSYHLVLLSIAFELKLSNISNAVLHI